MPFLHWLLLPGSLLEVHTSALPYYPSAEGLSTPQPAGGLPASHQVIYTAPRSDRRQHRSGEEAVETTTSHSDARPVTRLRTEI